MRHEKGRARTIVKVTEIPDGDSQVSRAVAGLREMLLCGEFRPNERIAEIPLSAKLGVSRTPLRLALERLANEGLIKALLHSGFAASEFSIDYIWDAIQTRGILEGAAARIAAERLRDPAQLEPMRKNCRAAEEILKSDPENFHQQYVELNEAFHSALLDLAGNQVLRRSAEQVKRLPFASPSGLLLIKQNLPGSMDVIHFAQEQHRGIVDAIENREGARAEALAREHSRISRRKLELALANRRFLESIPGGLLVKSDHRG
ncbi:MAG TPA: GntR family transcriptional regulator [Candidatus Acidoferrales bacterium]|nr:GntR family transcriptional regulator [Candidatus Acidoferrales bacterium]